jgi:hypothetical protein
MAKQPKTLEELFHDTLKDIYYAEKKIITAQPKLAKAAQTPELKSAFEKPLTERGSRALGSLYMPHRPRVGRRASCQRSRAMSEVDVFTTGIAIPTYVSFAPIASAAEKSTHAARIALRDRAPESDFRGYFLDTETKLDEGNIPRYRGISSAVRFNTR